MLSSSLLSNLRIGLISEDTSLINQLETLYPNQVITQAVPSSVLNDVDVVLVDDASFANVTPDTSVPYILLIDLQQTDLTEALSFGYTDYIPKPLQADVINHRLNHVLTQTSSGIIQDNDRKLQDLHAILSSMSDPVFVFSRDGIYQRIPENQSDNYYQPPDDLVGKSLRDVFEPELANRFIEIIEHALITQSRQILDYDLPIDNRRTYFSALINPIAGRDEVVWVARDVTHNRLNELALIETEKRYRQLFENANDMIVMVDLKTGAILSANKQVQKQLGYTQAELLRLKINDIEVSEQDTQSRVVTRTLTTSGYIVVEQTYRKKDGTEIPVETSSRLTTYRNRQVLLSFSRNIKQRKIAIQAEADERYFADVLRDSISQLAQAHTMDDVLDIMLSTVVKVISSESGNIMLIDDDTASVVRTYGYNDPDSQPDTLDIPSVFTLRQMRDTKQAVIIADIERDPRWVDFDEESWSKSYIGAPIRLNEDVIGYINLDSNTPNHFTNKHRQRLQVFADQSAIAIQNAHLYETNQRNMEELEARVQERTAELTRTNEELLHQITRRLEAEESLSEERNLLRTIIDSLPDTVYVKDNQRRYILANRFPHSSLAEQPFLSKTDAELTGEIHNIQIDNDQAVIHDGESIIDEEYHITEQGDERWIVHTKVPFYDEQGDIIGLVGVKHDITHIKMAERQLRQLLANAKCLLWYATVEYDGTKYNWHITVENEDNARQFLPFDTTQKDYVQAWIDSIPEDKQAIRQTVSGTHLKYNRDNYTIEYHCVTSDGQIHWLNEDVQIRPLTENRWHLIGVSLDITDIKSAELALRESYEEMEQRVIERTTELQHANEELQNEITIRHQAETAERQQRLIAEALKDSITVMNSTLNIEDVLDRILDGIELVADYTAANIVLLEDGLLKVVRQRGYQDTIPDRPIEVFEEINEIQHTKKYFIISDTENNEMWNGWDDYSWVKSNIKLPIIYQSNIVGIIVLDSDTPNNFTSEQADALQAFANQASIALNNANLYQQAQSEIEERKRAEAAEREQREFAETLRETAIILNQQLNINSLFDTVLTAINRIVSHHDTATIIIFDADTMLGTVVADYGYEQFGKSIKGLQIDFERSANQRQILQRHTPFLVIDTQTQDNWFEVEETRWIRSHIGVPIYIKDKVIALINLDSQHPNAFTQEDVNRVVVFSHQVAIAIQNAQLVEQIQANNQLLESRVEQRTYELELERSQLQAILNAIRDGVYYSSTHGDPIYINNALTNITGYSRDQWLNGEVFEQVNSDQELDRVKLWNNIQDYLRYNNFWHDEASLVRADGSVFDASITRTQVTGADGTLEGLVTVIRDISLQKQLEEQKARFIANAAHELRTPITNIKTRLFLMKHAPEKFREHLAIAESATTWLQTLVDNLFDHSRFERGIIQLDVEELILQDLLQMIIVTQQAEANHKHIDIITQWHAPEMRINLDKSRFRQVITNLLNNAIHYTPEHGHITITLAKLKNEYDSSFTIRIADTGIGIDPTHLPYLFQPFYRATDDGKGAGLGLSIAREIVEAHKGTISVESTVGEGTTFSITLPILTEQQLLEEA